MNTFDASEFPANQIDSEAEVQRLKTLLGQMHLHEKIGQMNQQNASEGYAPDYLGDGIRAGHIGSVLNVANLDTVSELQRIAVEDTRLGIPLLVGRDVIHGFRTILPIPLGQAATWNPELVRKGASVAAKEAATAGINWTFAPMVDISRDARWGRIAESFGEDVVLCSAFTEAMVEGFQGNFGQAGSIASCVKHFAGYGACESGRDYATTNIPENELRNVYLPPFKTAVDAGVLTFMTSFSDLNGVPATGNDFLLRQILRDEWQFEGMVVSDWDSVRQLEVHGVSPSVKESAFQALSAGVDMEMAGDAYSRHVAKLVEEGRIDIQLVDQAVENILRTKLRLGLFDNPYTHIEKLPTLLNEEALAAAQQLATQSIVLLKNDNNALPLSQKHLNSIAVIGPLADAPYEQLGTWVFDGEPGDTVTPLQSLKERFESSVKINVVRAMQNSRSKESGAFDEAVEAARESDVAVLFLGEESILSGEAHSRADINLPGDQAKLVRRIKQTGTPVIAVIMAGRPLTLSNIVDEVDAILYAWHPGTMGGPAIVSLLLGDVSPSGKLPVTFPRMVGQIPIYYNQKNTGKPPTPETVVHIDDIDTFAPQTSLGMTAFHLDAGYTPLFPFGFGLSYASFKYSNLQFEADTVNANGAVIVSCTLTNESLVDACEVAQLYVRDLVGQVTRPVKELKAFERVFVKAGRCVDLRFTLGPSDLSFFGRNMKQVTEPGEYQVWVGGSSQATLKANFRTV